MKNFAKNIWKEWKGELLLTALFVPLFWILMDTGYLNDAKIISWYTQIVLGALGVTALFLLLLKKMSWKKAALLMLLAGLVLRMGYTLGTHSYIRHHDYGDIYWYVYGHTEQQWVSDYGHAPYVIYLYLNRQLPHFNEGQFYHPPLFHILSALCMRITYKVLKIEDLIYLFESSKIISCLASCFALLQVPKICKELKIRRAGTCVAVSVMAFLPMFYLMASWVNNDGLVFFFMTWIVLYTIRWYHRPTWGNTLLLALGFGLGMMSKMSCALLAFFTGFVMLVRLLRTVQKGRLMPTGTLAAGKKKKPLMSLLFRFAGFAAVAFPLGLFFPIRNYIKFDQPFNYVLRLNIPEVPEKGFAARFLLFPFNRLFDPVFADSTEYNLNLFLLKTASFGEFAYEEALEPWGIAILAANLTLILLAFAAVVLVWRSSKQLFWRWGFLGLWILLYGSEAVFAYRYPYTCTMDARYVAPTVLLGALYLGKAVQLLEIQGCQIRTAEEETEKSGQTRKLRIQKIAFIGYRALVYLALGVLGIAGGYFFLHLT